MKKNLAVVSVLVLVVVGASLYYSGIFNAEENIRTATNPPVVQAFEEIQVNFEHMPGEGRFPFTGAAAIDVDGDGAMEVFVSGSSGQNSALFQYQNGEMVDIAIKSGLNIDDAAFGAASIDIENDGDVDLLVAQQDGPWLYLNNRGQFTAQKIDVDRPENSFSTSIAITDLNADGLPDLYVTNFVVLDKFVTATFNDPDHAKSNNMLLNIGNGEFQDVTAQTHTAGTQNTFVASFVDLDFDGLQDLVVANNTGTVEVFKNNGSLSFAKTSYASGLGYWMGIGIGDIDNDGDQDLFLSNIGSSIPAGLVRGDLRDDQQLNLEWLVLRNDGGMKLQEVTADYSLDGYGFAWGGVFEDINLDGAQDLLVAQNYINWPGHNIKKMENKAFLQLQQDDKSGFYHMDEIGLNNAYYGQSPLIVDVNGDNKPDVFWINMAGPVRGFLNKSNVPVIKVAVPDRTEFLGATLQLEFDDGQSYARQVIAGAGMGTDQSPDVFFAVPANKTPRTLRITLANGESRNVASPAVNSRIQLQ